MSRIRGKVVRIFSDTMIAINLGKEAGISEGMLFNIESVPVAIRDVDGTQLGSVAFKKGRVKVASVFAKFSLAKTEVVTDYGSLLGGGPGLTWPHPPGVKQEKLVVRAEDIDQLEGPGPVRVGDPVSSVDE